MKFKWVYLHLIEKEIVMENLYSLYDLNKENIFIKKRKGAGIGISNDF